MSDDKINVLEHIKAYKLKDLEERKKKRSFSQLEALAKDASYPRHFFFDLMQKYQVGKYALIAEIKKASPSKGLIRPDFDPASLAMAYEKGGAVCLSVLTDEPSFQGHDSFLKQARDACSLPVLRKDFIYDTYQVMESRVLEADCILLIMASLEDQQAVELEDCALENGMDVLIEVHNEQELDRALTHLCSPMIGINNRDLKTFKVDLKTTEDLAKKIPPNKLIISESGFFTSADLERMKPQDILCFLIGESLMRQDDVEQAVRDLIGNNN